MKTVQNFLNLYSTIHIFFSILQYFTKVKCLEIKYCWQITNNALTFIKSKDLETLKIVGCDGINQTTIEKFLEEYPIKIRFVDYDDYSDYYDNYQDQGYESYDDEDDIGYRVGGSKAHRDEYDDY